MIGPYSPLRQLFPLKPHSSLPAKYSIQPFHHYLIQAFPPTLHLWILCEFFFQNIFSIFSQGRNGIFKGAVFDIWIDVYVLERRTLQRNFHRNVVNVGDTTTFLSAEKMRHPLWVLARLEESVGSRGGSIYKGVAKAWWSSRWPSSGDSGGREETSGGLKA